MATFFKCSLFFFLRGWWGGGQSPTFFAVCQSDTEGQSYQICKKSSLIKSPGQLILSVCKNKFQLLVFCCSSSYHSSVPCITEALCQKFILIANTVTRLRILKLGQYRRRSLQFSMADWNQPVRVQLSIFQNQEILLKVVVCILK